MARLEVDIDANVKDLNKKLGQVDSNLNNTKKSFNNLEEFAIGALSGIAAAFSIQAITQFGKAVLDTTAKFQKFEAVLSNTLGSGSQAQIALQQIQDFASRTPFAVDELTEAFVKLANQGFKPTIDELRSLGDLASSTGKSFNQLAEAIIDAQVGEFERLKEFGIRAKKEGENVTFTFKGVETQVKSTDKAIRDYILSLGNAEGVTGAMAGISETLGGKLSNLGDNIEALRLAIGDQTSGVFATSIDWLNEFINLATLAAKGVSQIREEASLSTVGKVIEANRKQVEELAASYLELNPDFTSQQAFAKAISDVARSYREAADGGEAFRNQNYTFSELNQINEGFIGMAKELLNVSVGAGKAVQTLEEFSKIADTNNEEVFRKWTEEVDKFNKELSETQRLQKGIEDILESISSKTFVTKGIFDDDGNLTGTQNINNPLKDLQIQEFEINFNEADFDEKVNSFDQKIIDAGIRFQNTLARFNESLGMALSEGIAMAIGDIAFSIGQALGNGSNVLEAAGGALLGSLAAILNQLGQLAISTGVAILGIKLALKTLNPFVAIAAGTALIALAGFVSSKARSLGGSMGSGGGGNVSTGGAGASFTGSGVDSFGFNDINLTSTVKGTDIVLVVERTQNKEENG